MALTAARADMVVRDSGSWSDAFRFGTLGDTSWSFTGCAFHMDVKGSDDVVSPLISLTTANNRIVVDDVVQRVLHFNVTQADLEAALVPGCYEYELVMIDGSGIRTPLMYGKVKIKHGVTQS